MYSKHTRPSNIQGDDDQTQSGILSRTELDEAQPEGKTTYEKRIVDSERDVLQDQYQQHDKENNRDDGNTFKPGNIERETKQKLSSHKDVTNGEINGLNNDTNTSSATTLTNDEYVNILQSNSTTSARTPNKPLITDNISSEIAGRTGSNVRPYSAKLNSTFSEGVGITEKTGSKEHHYRTKEENISNQRNQSALEFVQNLKRQTPFTPNQNYSVSDASKGKPKQINDLNPVPYSCWSRPSSGVTGTLSSRPSSGVRGAYSRPSSGIKSASSRPSSGFKSVPSSLLPSGDRSDSRYRPSSGVEAGLSSRPSSGVKAALSRPSSGVKAALSRPSSGVRGTLSSRPSSGVKGVFSRPSSGVKGVSSRPVSAKIVEPRRYSSFYSIVDTVAKIRLWSKQKYRYRSRKRNRELSDHGATNDKLVRKSKTILAKQAQDMEEEQEREREREKIRKTRTFWWYCKVIKAVVKLALDMQKLSMQKTEQTPISEMYYINVAGPSIQEDGAEENQILFFDKSWFSRKRATSRVPEWAQATTLKAPEKRTEEEVLHLHNFLLNMRSFKEKFTEEMRLKICQAIRYTKCDKGRVILRQGHLGLDFYFIFSGSVFIQIDIEDKQTGTITTSTENVIRHGESFGEIALLGDDGKRSACVICREPTELFTLDKATFLDVCPGIFEKELQVKANFARQFPLFQNWDSENVEQLCFNSQVIYVPHGRTVDADWSKSNFVYFVMKGRISLLREFDVSDMYNMTALGMMDKEIHFRYTATNRSKRQIACIGWMHEGDASELRILSLEPSSNIESITMLSEGVKVFRVAVRTFKRLAPRRIVEDYLKKSYVPREIPSNSDICEKVFKDNIWSEYKRKVLTETVMQCRDMNISQVPATSKGSSGWARWPGYDVNANAKTGKLSDRSARSEINVFEFMNVSPVRGKFASPGDIHQNTRKEDKSKRQSYKRPPEKKPPPPEPVVLINDRTMISRPHPVRNIFELRANANRIKKKIELSESSNRQLDSGASTKSVFLTAPNHE